MNKKQLKKPCNITRKDIFEIFENDHIITINVKEPCSITFNKEGWVDKKGKVEYA